MDQADRAGIDQADRVGTDQPIDRRAFLVAAGAAGLTLSGCASHAASRARTLSGPPIRGRVLRHGTPGFTEAAKVYNERFEGVLPRWVARPLDAADVQSAVRWGVSEGVPLRARSGGHSYAGYSTLRGGAVLDLRNLRHVQVDRPARTATVGAGSQLIDVYGALAAHGMTIPAGSCPSVGIAGHALGGGMGLAARKWGLTADNLLEAELVSADGHRRTVNRHTDPGLFWALRGGGGGNFGIVTSFKFRIHPVPQSVAAFFVSWPWSEAANALGAWQAWAPHAQSELTSIFHLSAGAGHTSVSVSGQYMGPASHLTQLLAPLRSVAGASVSAHDHGYLEAQRLWAGCATISSAACHTKGTRPGGELPRESFRAKSDYVGRPLPATARQALVTAAAARAGLPGSGAILFDSYGGAIGRLAPHATAFVHREALCCIQYLTYNGGAAWLRSTWQKMRPHVTGGAYLNYTDPELGRWQHAYYGANYARLLAVKRRIDPHHYFTFPQAIGR
jgi:FAD/FMN-containing dehydrogenase